MFVWPRVVLTFNGNVIDNPDLISQHVRHYYYDLFTPKLLVKEIQHVLLSGMKHISEEQSVVKLLRLKN